MTSNEGKHNLAIIHHEVDLLQLPVKYCNIQMPLGVKNICCELYDNYKLQNKNMCMYMRMGECLQTLYWCILRWRADEGRKKQKYCMSLVTTCSCQTQLHTQHTTNKWKQDNPALTHSLCNGDQLFSSRQPSSAAQCSLCITQQVLLAVQCASNMESTRWNGDKSSLLDGKGG